NTRPRVLQPAPWPHRPADTSPGRASNLPGSSARETSAWGRHKAASLAARLRPRPGPGCWRQREWGQAWPVVILVSRTSRRERLWRAVGVGDCARISRLPFVLDALRGPVFHDDRSCGPRAVAAAPGRTRPPAPHALG